MAGNTVQLTFAGDSKSLEKTFERVGTGAKDMAKDLDKASDRAKGFGGAMDKAGDAADKSEGKFMGAADLLDGLGGAFGLPTEGATNMMRSFGDLSGGISSLGPMLGGLATGPVMLIAAGIAAATVAIIALYKNSETFRDIVSAAFEAVKKALGPIIEGIGKAVGWVVGLFKSGGEDTEEATDVMKEALASLNAALEAQRQRWQAWKDKVTESLNGILNPLQTARDQSKVGFDEINKNLIDNTAFFHGWINNLNVLMKRGFGDLAEKMFELGPTAEKAVGEMIHKSDRELTVMTERFGTAGNAANRAFMTPFMTNESLRAIDGVGVQWGAQFAKGFDAGLGKINVPVNRVGPSVPHFAEGGIVTGPTLAVIGEAGPEAIVPLNRSHSGAAAGAVNVYFTGVVGDPTAVARQIDNVLRQARTRGVIPAA